jgi:parvulin-like peptidyl-prolyl isomerase
MQPEIRLSAILIDNSIIADSIGKLLVGGGQFAKLAEKFSIQKHTAVMGGDLGFYHNDELGDLKAKLFSLKIGEWTGPIIEDGKYLFVKCTDKKESKDKSFEESSKEVKDTLVGMAWLNYRNQCVESFKKKIECKIYTERLKVLNLN